MKRFDIRTQQWVAWGLLVLAMVVYAIQMSHQAVLRYDTFKATAFDLGNMDQVLWNTIHGYPFRFTNQAIDWYGPPTRLAIHFEPIILPLSLLYLFHADPRILLVFQTLVLISGALPVFLLTRKYLPEWPLLAAIMAIAYLLTPALLGLNIFDFHPVSLATPFLLYALLALAHKRYVWFLIACVLAASCKEDVPLAIAGLGILLIWKYKQPRLGTTLLVGGILWSALAFGFIIPHFYPGAHYNNYWYRYEALGSSPGAAIVNLLLHPWLLFATFVTLDRFYYLAGLFRSSGFLSLLAPEWLLPALPSLAVNLLSTDPLLYSGGYHYNATIIPFVMLSAIHGARRLVALWYGWRGEIQEIEGNTVPVGSGEGGSGEGALVDTSPPERVPCLGDRYARRFLLHTIQRLQQRLQTRTQHIVQWKRFNERMVPLAKRISVPYLQWVAFAWLAVTIWLNFMIAAPVLNIFWANHEPGTHEQHIQQLLAMIPPDASVSAGGNLNPHLSERQKLAVFPAVNTSVQYIVVDLSAVFPEDRVTVTSELDDLVASGQFCLLARAESVVLYIRCSTA